jgi:hypothetical protein
MPVYSRGGGLEPSHGSKGLGVVGLRTGDAVGDPAAPPDVAEGSVGAAGDVFVVVGEEAAFGAGLAVSGFEPAVDEGPQPPASAAATRRADPRTAPSGGRWS